MLYITFPSQEEALRVGDTVVRERLAACSNTISPTTSTFIWQGRCDTAEEAVLLVKTLPRTAQRLATRVRELHSYEVPCILETRFISHNPDYFRWVDESVD